MNPVIIGIFNNKGGVGKTSLVHHLSCMYAELGVRIVAADLDPQANLTAAFLDEDRLEELWPEGAHPQTIYGFVSPLMKGVGNVASPHLETIDDNLALLAGDLALSGFEDELSDVWPKCLEGNERAFRVIRSFWEILHNAAKSHRADLVLVDLGPNLGAINRAALIGIDYLVVPLSPDLFSLQGLRNLGPTLWKWRSEWFERVKKKPQELKIPSGKMEPIGYIVLQHSVRLDRPVQAYERWIKRIPDEYRIAVLDEPKSRKLITVEDDPNCLSLIKHYMSLMAMAQESRKPVFKLKPADGAIGAHLTAVQNAYSDFKKLAQKIARKTGISLT